MDDILRAILTPREGEDPSLTARPRAVLAALCLADEPNASDEVAHEILQAFSRQVGEYDGSVVFARDRIPGTSLDAAAMELAASVWAEALRLNLVQEYLAGNSTAFAFSFSCLCIIVDAAFAAGEAPMLETWLAEQVARIASNDAGVACAAAFAVIQDSVRGGPGLVDGRLVTRLVDGLLTMLERTNHEAMAGSLALFCLRTGWIGFYLSTQTH